MPPYFWTVFWGTIAAIFWVCIITALWIIPFAADRMHWAVRSLTLVLALIVTAAGCAALTFFPA